MNEGLGPEREQERARRPEHRMMARLREQARATMQEQT